MQLDVVVLRRLTTEEIDSWRYVPDGHGGIITQHKDGKCLASDESWRELAVAINQMACAGSQHDTYVPLQTDVFLIMSGLLRGNLSTVPKLENIINEARNHTWGADIYLVWDQTPDNSFIRLYGASVTKLEQFFGAVLNARVTDLIEVTANAKKKEPDEYSRLSESALKSKKRWEKLRELVDEDGWEILLHDRSLVINRFLDTLFEKEPELTTGKNLAVFYEHDPRQDRMGGLTYLYGKSAKFYGGGNLLAATILERDENDLRVLWKEKNPEAESFHFNGIWEWLYTFIRLRRAGGRGTAAAEKTDGRHEPVGLVEPSERMLSRHEPDPRGRSLLVTSSFHVKERLTRNDDPQRPDRERAFCVHAANEIGDMLHGLPFHIAIEVHHCITCEQLPDLLKDKSFTAWLHLGHGQREGGLLEAPAGPWEIEQYASPERWRDCFNVYEERLPLVIFSACESSGIARMFAGSVSRIAIGFENEVLTRATRRFSAEVMPAALRAGDRQAAILQAFRAACAMLSSKSRSGGGEEEHRQKERFSDAEPRAFMSSLESS